MKLLTKHGDVQACLSYQLLSGLRLKKKITSLRLQKHLSETLFQSVVLKRVDIKLSVQRASFYIADPRFLQVPACIVLLPKQMQMRNRFD